MGTNSDNLAADLMELKQTGELNLPRIARHYAQASRDLHNAGYYNDPEAPGMAAISVFRDVVQNCMVASYANMMDNAKAILTIMDAYAATDQEAAERLQRDWDANMSNEYLNPHEPPMPVPVPASSEKYEVEKRTVQVPGPNGPVTVEEEVPVR